MPEVTILRQGQLMQKLFQILVKNPDGLRAQDALNELRSSLPLTPYEQGAYESGGVRFDKIVRFATIDYVKAGWMVKDHALWYITDLGREALAKYKNPEDFHRAAFKLYKAWKANRPEISTDIEAEPSDKAATITYEQAEEQARGEIEEYFRVMNPYDLQKLVAALLRAMGYHVSWIAPAGKDGGVDILAWNDPLGTRPPRIKVQVKREQTATSVTDLRSFMSLLGDDDVGIFVNIGGFTRDAQDTARMQESRQVTLIDLDRLLELWIEYSEKLDQEAHDRLPLKPIYFLAPDN